MKNSNNPIKHSFILIKKNRMLYTQYSIDQATLAGSLPTTENNNKPFIRVHFSDSSDHSDFHYFWLRHNCNHVPKSRHGKTLDRIVDSSEIDINIEPERVEVLNLDS